MTNIFKGEHFTDKAKDAKFMPHLVIILILFLLVFIGGNTLMAFPQFALTFALADINMSGEAPTFTLSPENAEWYTTFTLLLTIIPAAVTILYCRFIERRSLESMGLKKEKFLPNYAIGLVIGFAAYSATLGITALAGAANYEGGDFRNPLMYAVICVGWIIQGAEEEIVCRGYMMATLSTKMPLWVAVLVSSASFGIMHFFNTGFSVLAFINITLVGIAFALLAIRCNSLIPSCAFHSVWNWAQGNFYGMPVSGNASGPSVMKFSLPEGMDIWTGGAFGVESGLGTTIIMIVLSAALLLIPQRSKEAA